MQNDLYDEASDDEAVEISNGMLKSIIWLGVAGAIVGILGLIYISGMGSMPKNIQSNEILKDILIMKDAQSGVVGLAGSELTINPNGTWTKTQFWGEKREIIKEGQLTFDQMIKITQVIRELENFPSESGNLDPTSNPNPHYLIIELNGKSTKLNGKSTKLLLPAKISLNDYLKSATGDELAAAKRFEAIINEIKKIAD